MLSSEFNQVVDILRTVVRNVSRLSDERSPKWFRHVVEEKQQKLRLNEVQEFKRGAVAILAVINDRDMQQEPLPWSVLRRHAENVPLWLDRLVKKPVEYEKYKNRLLMSIDTFVQNAENSRVPLASSRWRSTTAGLIMAVCGGIAGLAGCAPARLYAEEPKVEEKDVKEYPRNYDEFLKVTGFTEETVNKLMEKDIEGILKDTEIIKGGTIKRVTYDAEKKTNNYEDLLKNGCGKYVVLFSAKGDISKRAVIQFKGIAACSAKIGEKIDFLYFDMDIDPEWAKNSYAKFNKDQKVLTCPSLQLITHSENNSLIVDSSRGGPLDSKSVLAGIYNGLVNWAEPLFFGKPTDDGKTYKYQNTGKLQEIAQK